MRGEHVPPLVVSQRHYLGAEAAHRGKLGLRRTVWDDDRARDAMLARRPCKPLGHVARAGGVDAGGKLVGRQHAQGVGRATNLEAADRLQCFQLQVDAVDALEQD